MRHIFFVLGLLPFIYFAANAQPAATQSQFVGTCQFTGFSPSGANVVGTLTNFLDQTNLYFASNIQVGDVAWDNLGTRWEIVAVISSNLVQAEVEMTNLNGTGGLPFGQGFVSRETPNLGLSMLPPDNAVGISPQLKSRVESHNLLIIDSLSKGNGIYGGSGTIPLNGVSIVIPNSNSFPTFVGNSSGAPVNFLSANNQGSTAIGYTLSISGLGLTSLFSNTDEIRKVTSASALRRNYSIGVAALDGTNINHNNLFLDLFAQGQNVGGPPNNFVRLRLSGNGLVFSDSRGNDPSYATPGITYAFDYSASFSNRSLVDKAYTDTRLGGRSLFNTPNPTAGQYYAWNNATSRFELTNPSAGTTNLTLSGAGPIALNSSNGTGISFAAGQNVTLSQASNVLTINAANTDLTYTGLGPFTLNSSNGTDVTHSEGLGMDMTRSGNNLEFKVDTAVIATQQYVDDAIADIPAPPGTDLSYTGTGPFTLNSSNGTDVTHSEGLGMDMTRSGNNLEFKVDTAVIATQQYVDDAVAGVATDLTLSGSTTPSFGPITIENSAGSDVTISSAGIISVRRSGNNLLIESTATPSSENIYNSNGSVPSGTNRTVTLTGSAGLTVVRPVDNYGYNVTASGVRIGNLGGNGGAIATNSGIDVSGNGSNGVLGLIATGGNTVDIAPATSTQNWQLILPTTPGNAGQMLVTDGSGATNWQTPTAAVTDLTYTGLGPFTLNSSNGTDVTHSEGLGIDMTRSGNNLEFRVDTAVIATQQYVDDAIADIPASGTNLGFQILNAGEGARILSSTGTDLELEGSGITFADGGGLLTVSAAATNLSFTGTGPVTLASSTGSDVTITAGTGITVTQSGGNNITIAASGGGGGGVVSGIFTGGTGISNAEVNVSVSAGSGAKPAVVTPIGNTTPIILAASYNSGTLNVKAWSAGGSPLTETIISFSYIIGGQ